LNSVFSGFRRDVDEICVLLGCYAAPSANPLLTFGDKSFALEDGTDTLYRNVGKGLTLGAAQYRRRAQISTFNARFILAS
jgi:hypothetical protein